MSGDLPFFSTWKPIWDGRPEGQAAKPRRHAIETQEDYDLTDPHPPDC